MTLITEDYIKTRLISLNINSDLVFDKYAEKHRYFHTMTHIVNMLNYVNKYNNDELENDELFLAIVFHDIIYCPKRTDNENESSIFAIRATNHIKPAVDSYLISDLILSTKDHSSYDKLSSIIIDADLNVLRGTTSELLKYEEQIYKEYQFADWLSYKEKRIQVLKKYAEHFKALNNNIQELINFIENKKLNIGLYCGSFAPFHKGHLNILEKAEKIFDKVIVAYGNNPDKKYKERIIPDELFYRQVLNYDTLLSDFIETLPYDVTVIRGMRNTTDFQYELNQYRFIQEMKPDIKVVSIFCDKEFEHISSSALKVLDAYNKPNKYTVK